jgi:hypothetical protein
MGDLRGEKQRRVMQVTPERVAAVYDCLRHFPPFCSWKLPPADEIELHISLQEDAFAVYHRKGAQHGITVSMTLVKNWQTLVESVAHEMIHLHQARAGTETRAEHNREWHRLAKTVCDSFVWKREGF